MRTAVERAKAGDGPMLKFLLSRIFPRERLIEFDLPPMNFADEAVASLGRILGAVAQGRISPSEEYTVGADRHLHGAIEMADVVKRLDALEAKLNNGGVQ